MMVGCSLQPCPGRLAALVLSMLLPFITENTHVDIMTGCLSLLTLPSFSPGAVPHALLHLLQDALAYAAADHTLGCLSRCGSTPIKAVVVDAAAAAAPEGPWPALTSQPAWRHVPAGAWAGGSSVLRLASSSQPSLTAATADGSSPATALPSARVCTAGCEADAEDVAPRLAPAVVAPAAALPWPIPARRPDASAATLAGCRLSIPVHSPTTAAAASAAEQPASICCAQLLAAPYRVPQRRTLEELAAAHVAGRPGKPCAWPQLPAGPQLQPATAVWTAAPIPLYLMAALNWTIDCNRQPRC